MFYRLLVILTFLLLTSCGGGSGSSSQDDVVEPPPAAPLPTTTNTTGVITGFGSVFINGVEYETDATEVSTDDDDNASETDLHVGMVVLLNGEVNEDGLTGTATRIHYDEQIKGPLESIDLAANSLVVLSQTVLFDDLTSLDNLVLDDLSPGDFLEISGFYNADNQLYATRIEKEDDALQLKIQGKISALNTAEQSFLLGDLRIDYRSAQFQNLSEADLANDVMVRVKGDLTSLVDDVFTISDIKISNVEDEHDEGDSRHLEGIISSFDSASRFVVNGVPITTDSTTEFEHGTVASLTLNIRVKIKGAYDVDGNLHADEIRIHQRTNLNLEGAVQNLDFDLGTVTVLDVIFTVNNQTKMLDKSDNGVRFFDLTDLSLGDFIEIKGFIDNDGNKLASKLERENEGADAETELKGLVSDIENFSFVVVDIMVTTNENTEFEDSEGDDVSRDVFFEQLEAGMLLEVKGLVIEGEFVAHHVEVETTMKMDGEGDDDNEEGIHGMHRTEFRGVITDLQGESLFVADHSVTITDQTKFEVEDSKVSAEQFWQLVNIGDQVKVKGTIDDQGAITAKSIELEIEHQVGVAEAKIWGVPVFTNETLTLVEHEINFDSTTEFEGSDDELSLAAFIEQVGLWTGIEVEGVLRGDILFAQKIEFSDDEDKFGDFEIEGRVESLIDNGVIVGEHRGLFGEQTEFYIAGQEVNSAEFLSNLSENSTIELKGKINFSTLDDGSLSEFISVDEIKLK